MVSNIIFIFLEHLFVGFRRFLLMIAHRGAVAAVSLMGVVQLRVVSIGQFLEGGEGVLVVAD